MASKRYLSNKKTSSQNISISPALKDKIERYVRKMHKKNPDDERYKSVSSFYCETFENVLKIFEKGKTLDDFDQIIDKDVRNLIDDYTFNGLIPMYEAGVESHRYIPFDFDSMIRYIFFLRKYYMKGFDFHNFNSIKLQLEKLNNFHKKNKISIDETLEIFQGKKREETTGTFEFSANYNNLHYINCKLDVVVFGMLGIKITDFIYSDKNYYARFNLKVTDLLFRKEIAKKERLELINENLKFLINFAKVVNDKSYHLWIKLADDNEFLLTFKKQDYFNKWMEEIEQDFRKYDFKEKFFINLLKFFEHLHWIKILNEKELTFQFELPEENSKEKQFFLNYMVRHSKIIEKENRYYMEV